MDNYERWLEQATEDPDLIEELRNMNDEQKNDAFYRDLAFGTGGLRGVIGAGTNRMNVYTVGKASQGLAEAAEEGPIAISYDSRIKSRLFAEKAASVFAGNGRHVYMWPELMPTPCLSFAVRYLHCAAGVMVTASHNPSEYNGYKVYGSDGCQITDAEAARILAKIEATDLFHGVRTMNFETGVQNGIIEYIGDDVYDAFIAEVRAQSLAEDEEMDKDAAIIYTPLNGTGLKPVLRVLKEAGYTNVSVVAEQEQPDGNFPTCPYPNPEIREAMELGLKTAKEKNADLLIATDPDCDRVGIAVGDDQGGYRLLTGNETGVLLLDYICARRIERGTMPERPVFVKTIVTSDLAEQIAASYGVETTNVLTGFKYIGETIGRLEQAGEANRYICGFEESYGYLTGTYVRDKDAVDGTFMICEMYAYYRKRGISLTQKLAEIYAKYGYCLNTLHSYTFGGQAGFRHMQSIMARLRGGIGSVCGVSVTEMLDYAQGIDGLPKSDVLKFRLENGSSFVVRPSGTEPKLKVYAMIRMPGRAQAAAFEQLAVKELEHIIK
ncbi:MAG: phospho-sugar mutase [Solobacterium sp.]|nr:phospho-sugar mutase [Solobacterium sp.]